MRCPSQTEGPSPKGPSPKVPGDLSPAAVTALKAQALHLWQHDRARWLIQRPFLAALAMRLALVPVIDHRVTTACTDGRSVFVNAAWLVRLGPSQRGELLAHEVWHCALEHFLRQNLRQHHLWNLAVDHEVNGLMQEDGMPMTLPGIWWPEWEGRNAEWVYNRLLEGAQRHPPAPVTAGLHLPLEHEGNATGPVDPSFNPQPLEPGQWEDFVRQEVRNHAPGQFPGSLALRFGRIPAAVNWRAMLSRFIAQERGGRGDWTRPDRRFLHAGQILPGRAKRRFRLVVAVDVSGSCVEALPLLLDACQRLLDSCQVVEIRLLTFDVGVRLDRLVRPGERLEAAGLPLTGGGGTSFVGAVERAETTRADGLVILTDGYGPAPEKAPRLPVLWLLTNGGRAPVAWGWRAPLRAA